MVTMAKDGGCRGRGRTGASSLGCLSLMLALVVVGGLRNAVPDDYYQNGYDEAASLHRLGGLVGILARSRTSKRLLVKGAPGLSKEGPLKPRGAVTRCPVATPAALEWQEGSHSNLTMPSERARTAGVVWPVTCLGSGPGMFTTMVMPPSSELQVWKASLGRL